MTTPPIAPDGGGRISSGARDHRSIVPYVAGVVVAGLVAGGFALGVYVGNLHNGLIAAAFAAVGIFVLHRRPDNREARLFLATGAASAVMFFGRQYGLHVADTGVSLPAVRWIAWLGVWLLPLVLALVGITILSFPDGRLPSPRWRLVVWSMLLIAAALAMVSALWPVGYPDAGLPIAPPLRVGGWATAREAWPFVGPPAYLAFQLAWAAGVIVRLRRADRDEARQLSWFVYAVALGAAVMVAGLVIAGSPLPGVLAAPLIAVAAGSAILKYRLYDIDVVVDKTLVVGGMAGLVTAAYVAVVAGVGGALGVTASPNLLLSLVATALIAVAFDPVRRRLQGWVDRLVYGDRPTPYEALARMSNQLTDRRDRDDLFAGLASTVADAVGASEVTLWVGSADELVAVTSWPPAADPPPALAASLVGLSELARDGGRTHVRPILHKGELRGAVTLTKAPGEALTATADRLLGDLAAQAGLVIDNVGLGAELHDRLRQIAVQAAELRAASKRIVASQDDARRRIERDLHDGAQQRLVTLALDLQAVAQQAHSTGHVELMDGVERAREELTGALSELREMARGIHPTALTEDGLEAALGVLAERSPVPVHIRFQLEDRLSPEVEAAAYFVVSEALTNSAKHAHASTVTVAGGLKGGHLIVEVTDDGRGGADDRCGSGLQGLADRLATLGGRLAVNSPAGAGTHLRAEIPCR